jgi:hypothetical protein
MMIRRLLSGGDRRGIAQSNRVRRTVEKDPSLVSELAALTKDEDWLVAQRAIDLFEKLAHDHPDWIRPHKKVFIGPLAESDKWEIRLQIVRALPLFRWSPAQSKRVEAILIENVSFPQTFVRAWALDSLATLAGTKASLMPLVRKHLRVFERSPSKALQARAKHIRARLGVIIAVLLLPATLASAQKVSESCEGIEVVSDELKQKEAVDYCRFASAERKKVEKYWGATWSGPIRINVSRAFAIAQALIPNGGKPGYIEMPLDRAKDKTGALLHEITHNYAPGQRNRFLYEGLGVFLQDKLSSERAFPNFGQPLHVAAAMLRPSTNALDQLNEVRYPRPLDTVMQNRAAYILAGSFTKFLIDTYGLDRYRKLYETGSYEEAYQKPFTALEAEWRARL